MKGGIPSLIISEIQIQTAVGCLCTVITIAGGGGQG